MALDDIVIQIEEYFEAQWPLLSGGVASSFYGSGIKNDGFPHVVVHVIPSYSINLGFNNPPSRTGNVSVMIFTKANVGVGTGWRIGDAVKEVFENKRINNIRLYETTILDRGIDGNMHVFEAFTNYEVEMS